MIRRLGRVFAALAIVYLMAVLGMYFSQRSLQYHPDITAVGEPAAYGVAAMKPVTVTTDDGIDLSGWFTPPARKGGKVIVFFHGNAGNITTRAYKAADFIAKGYGFYLAEYRGFGGNKGIPTEDGFYRDGRAVLKWLEAQGYKPSQMIFYGESIGTGVAVQMAVEVPPSQVILEAPFTSAADVAKMRYFWLPVDFLMKDRFDSIKKIAKIKAPVLILHGTKDLVVPFDEGKALFDHANEPKVFAEFDGGGHSDLYNFGAGKRIADWLDIQLVEIKPHHDKK